LSVYVYVDSSFLVSVYLTDTHSPDSRKRAQNTAPFVLTPLHEAEWAHALAQHVFRGMLAPSQARTLESQLKDDKTAGVWTDTELPENAFALCADLARRFGPRLGFRTLDSLHVASALELGAERFWTFDERQRDLAKAAGLKT
jgi:predicted nucleic acid-binding protein